MDTNYFLIAIYTSYIQYYIAIVNKYQPIFKLNKFYILIIIILVLHRKHFNDVNLTIMKILKFLLIVLQTLFFIRLAY